VGAWGPAILSDDGDAPTWAEADPADRRKRTAALGKLRDQLTRPSPTAGGCAAPSSTAPAWSWATSWP
jgi:hypothetical protein